VDKITTATAKLLFDLIIQQYQTMRSIECNIQSHFDSLELIKAHDFL